MKTLGVRVSEYIELRTLSNQDAKLQQGQAAENANEQRNIGQTA